MDLRLYNEAIINLRRIDGELMVDLSFNFQGECWLWAGEKAAWHFIRLPQEKSAEIKFFNENLHEKKRGWGAVRVEVTIGKTTWQTSIFPDAKSGSYLLPTKSSVRKAEGFAAGDLVEVQLHIEV